MRVIRNLVVALVPLALLLAACNSNNSSTSTASKADSGANAPAPAAPSEATIPDPCKLLSKDEAAAILGEAVRDPEPSNLGDTHVCDFKSEKLHGGIAPYSIHIALTPEAKKIWDTGKKLHTAKEMQPVSGIGEEAMFVLDDLEVYAKGLSININVLKEIDKPDHMKAVQAGERAVAEKAIPRV